MYNTLYLYNTQAGLAGPSLCLAAATAAVRDGGGAAAQVRCASALLGTPAALTRAL